MKFDPEVTPILEYLQSIKNPDSTRDFAFQKGVEFYKRAKFFEAHEIFEFQWKKEEGELKLFQQALIQICIAMNKIFVNVNHIGAESQLIKAKDKLESLLNKNFFTEKGKLFTLDLLVNIHLCLKILSSNEKSFENYTAYPLEMNWKELIL
jgi:hypothetical protein